MTAADYKISFPFGATSAPYSAAHAHRGDDRPTPTGTAVVIAGVTIGLTGATGNVTGAHLHTQEWQGTVANVRKPQNAFKPGTVTQAGTSSDFGNYITIQTADGWCDSYCHLSQINVKVGQVIGGNMTKEEITVAYMGFFDCDEGGVNYDFVKAYTGHPASEVLTSLINDPSYKEHKAKVNNPSDAIQLKPGTYRV